MDREEINHYLKQAEDHLVNELLPFWYTRMVDERHGGFITHFDENGNDTGEDEKSLIAQTRSVYTLSSAHRAGYGNGKLAEMAEHGINFMINKMWDKEYGGFYWMTDRAGNVKVDKKILYGHSFAIYCLSEYTLATGDPRGIEYAEKTFELIQANGTDTYYGGYFEMFDRDWTLAGPGSLGGDRKTLDVHMHLMEAFTTLYECSRKEVHRRKLFEDINILLNRMLHPEYKTGIPQFFADWKVAPQIKFDIVWGWDRFAEEGKKSNPTDNTCYGHNAELAWLLNHALEVTGTATEPYRDLLSTIFMHTLNNGVDTEYGGVFVEGPHSGGVYDREKEFWQQAEVMIGMLDAYLQSGKEKYWEAYKNIHRFVFDKVINRKTGEWYPLLTREGQPIWTHMSHSWKINYHTVRAMIQSIARMKRITGMIRT
ncbi:MAG: N-acylglucosamine 2-epimerase [Chlorobi bacterium]|nr:N-acylglucosamine 2-epimerase [Chlorobiota bacterium]